MSLMEALFPTINDVALGRRMDLFRARAADAARGRVLEVGAGTGLNFRHYAPGVELCAIEPSPAMRRRAEERARDPRVQAKIRLQDGDVQALPFGDEELDAVVTTFVLCSVRDLMGAARELRRVLRPGGVLSLVEHRRSPQPSLARWQRRVEPLWRRLFGGCHLTRDVRVALSEAGFDVGSIEEVTLPLPRLASPGLIGVARAR
jgi:ubiquinone/menaquinone biosynthesis C-methylase UbiE